MEKNYAQIMEHIYPTEEQKDRMFENIFTAKCTEKRRRPKIRCFAVALAACTAVSTTAVFAEEIKSTVYNLLGKNETVSEKVLNDIFTDTNGHVSMSVKEVLSDRINNRAVIEYTILDEEGRSWIDDFQSANEDVPMGFEIAQIKPHLKDENSYDYGVSYSYDCRELPEYKTEDKRVFMAVCETSGVEYGTSMIDLEYRMSDKKENHAIIDVSESVELKDIKLDSSLAPSDKPYKPLGVMISPLSLYVYGENCGLYESGLTDDGGYYSRLLTDEGIDSLILVMKNGERHNMFTDYNIQSSGPFYLGGVCDSADGYDVSIFCTDFKEPMDMSAIDGIELDGVFYPLGL